jgi:hypothetical protein
VQGRNRGIAAAAVIAAGLALVPAPAGAAKWTRCKPVEDLPELDGSRYEGADVMRIRALRVRCGAARRIAHRATLRGMELGSRISIYSYRRVWLIERDLRGDIDRYDATKIADVKQTTRVRWRFGRS